MMRLSYIKTHWTPEEARSILAFLDELRDAIWQNYGNEIIEHCHQQEEGEKESCSDIEDDIIPF